MCRNELGEFYRWWIFIGVRPLLRIPAPAALVLPAHRKLTPTYRAAVYLPRMDLTGSDSGMIPNKFPQIRLVL
jgi:hypothetical protein